MPPCNYALNPTSASYDALGGAGMVAVAAGTGCNWTAVSNDGFLTVTGGASGTGNGTVTYNVATNTGAPNVANPARAGSLTIAGQTFQVNQTGCMFGIAPIGATLGSAASSGAVTVTTPSVCSWTVTGLPAWASTTSGGSGTGTGSWQYAVSANAAGVTRSQVITVAALAPNFTLTQLGRSVKPLVPGTRTTFTLANVGDEQWASFEMVEKRSYCTRLASAATAVNQATPSVDTFRADATTALGSTALGGQCFIAPATETGVVRVTQDDTSARPYRLAVIESTLWANWFFIGGDYSSYTILRNTAAGPVTATITWRNLSGNIVGSQTVGVPPGGVTFWGARSTSGFVAGSVEVAHDGEPGAIRGSQTTLSVTTGQSFDTIFVARDRW
jgi:hypothetical protein